MPRKTENYPATPLLERQTSGVDSASSVFSEGAFFFGYIEDPEKGMAEGQPLYGKYNGLYTVIVESFSQRWHHVCLMWMGIGFGAQSGQPLPRGTKVLIAIVTKNKIPVILGAVGLRVSNDYYDLEIDEPKPGEVFLQAAIRKDVNDPKDSISTGGARLKLDEFGNAFLETATGGDYIQIGLGDFGLDVFTQEQVIAKIKAGLASIEMESGGSISIKSSNMLLEDSAYKRCKTDSDNMDYTGGNRTFYVEKSFTVLHKSGSQVQINDDGECIITDKEGNTLLLNSDVITMISKTGAYVSLEGDNLSCFAKDDAVIHANTATMSGKSVFLGDQASKGVAREGDACVTFCPLIGKNIAGVVDDAIKYPFSGAPPALPGQHVSKTVKAID